MYASGKSQTSSEYIMILAIVLILSILVVGIMGGFQTSLSNADKESSDTDYRTDEVSIEDYYFTNTSSIIKIKNNFPGAIRVTAIRYNNNETLTCNSSNSLLPVELNFGSYASITCPFGKDQYPFSENLAPIISIRFVEKKTGAAYTSGTGDQILGYTGEISNCVKYGNCPAVVQPFECNNQSEFHNGNGSLAKPYGICTWSHLNNIRNHLSSSYILLTNLSSSSENYTGIGSNWQPIGNQSGNKFSGTFNGNYYLISDLKVNKSSSTNVGLFGYVAGDIFNVGIVNENVSGLANVGGLVGYFSSGNIYDSFTDGYIYGSGSYVGGLVGYQDGGNITNCYTTGIVIVS